jgi:hypothetical protein
MVLSTRKKGLLTAGGCGLVLAAAAGLYWFLGPWFLAGSSDEYLPGPRQMSRQDPATEFPVVPAGEVTETLTPGELVLGVTIGKEARAYPVNMLNVFPERKILNDTLGGQAIAVTWCDRCLTGIVFARELDRRTLTLGVEGRLWKENMIMYDRETHSQWSQFQGEAKAGPLKGKKLRQIPSVLTDWRSWRRLHPEGTVVELPYMLRQFTRYSFPKLGRLVLGISAGGKARAWGLDELDRTRVREDEWDGKPVLALFDRAGVSARLYQRTLRGRILSFRYDGDRLTDGETGSTWEPVTGRALTGPLAGQHLVPLPAFVCYRWVWEQFHPEEE